jgi:hypothetical protein
MKEECYRGLSSTPVFELKLGRRVCECEFRGTFRGTRRVNERKLIICVSHIIYLISHSRNRKLGAVLRMLKWCYV